MTRLGIALALSQTHSRKAICQLARTSSRLAFFYDTLWETEEAWEGFELAGEDHLRHALQAGRGAILAPIHFGRYRWLPIALAHQLERDVLLLIDQPNHQHFQADGTPEEWRERFPHFGRWNRIEAVSSHSPTVLWEMQRALRQGRLVIMFIDGNSGMEGRLPDEDCVKVSFFGERIRVRRGIAALSAASGAPIVPVCTRDRARHPPLLEFDTPLQPPSLAASTRAERTAWSERSMAHLYAFLEQQVKRRPARWEEWHLFPRWLDRKAQPFSAPAPGRVSGRPAQRVMSLQYPHLWPVTLEGKTHLIDVKSLASLGSDPVLTELFEAAEEQRRVETWLQAHMAFPSHLQLLKTLVAQGIISMTEPAPQG
ncbi:MAG: hypothetical protein ACKO6N_18250 [Myxococcota bacterium]